MAITPNTFKNLTFGGVNSADYGVYISGEGVYNAPSRAVELTQIPGRNGAIPVDMGYWENIEIVYPCGMFGSDQTDFAQNYSDFINAIASQKGYQRLEDTYHTDEFRQALFVSGVETKPIGFGQAGEFELVFNCKPQRFLKSGEDPVAVGNGGTIMNQTNYAAKPILSINGYSGTIAINENEITISGGTFGVIEVAPPVEGVAVRNDTWSNLKYHNADPISMDTFALSVDLRIGTSTMSSASVTSISADLSSAVSFSRVSSSVWSIELTQNVTGFTAVAGTSSNKQYQSQITYVDINGSHTFTFTTTITYNPNSAESSDSLAVTYAIAPITAASTNWSSIEVSFGSVTVDSSKSKLGNPTYIDCEIGEAYKVENGKTVLLNDVVSIGADLPVLDPGTNTITYSGIGLAVSVIPRWWKL